MRRELIFIYQYPAYTYILNPSYDTVHRFEIHLLHTTKMKNLKSTSVPPCLLGDNTDSDQRMLVLREHIFSEKPYSGSALLFDTVVIFLFLWLIFARALFLYAPSHQVSKTGHNICFTYVTLTAPILLQAQSHIVSRRLNWRHSSFAQTKGLIRY